MTALEDDKPNGRIGAALEVVGKYEVSKGITLTPGPGNPINLPKAIFDSIIISVIRREDTQ